MARAWEKLKARLKALTPARIVLVLLKSSIMIAAVVLVFVFEAQRTKQTSIYHTSDPLDRTRNGVNCTCGCSLPATLQTAQNPLDESPSDWNVCYDSNSLETVKILMYPNFTGVDALEKILYHAYSEKFNESRKHKVVQGVNATVQAHDLAWQDRGTASAYANSTEISHLYPGGFPLDDWYISSDYLLDGDGFWDFPSSYLRITFSFMCGNCSTCNLSTVNQLFISAAGTSVQKAPWGQCVYWGYDDQCIPSNFYQAKCSIYPGVASVPLPFGVSKFFQSFFNLEGIGNVRDPATGRGKNITTLTSSELYMNLRLDLLGMVNLSFLEIERGSSALLSFFDQFPTLDSECSELKKVTTFNGSSVCNLYKKSDTDEPLHSCLDMINEASCRSMHSGATIDEVPGWVWDFFNVTGQQTWLDLMCPPYRSESKAPYLVLPQTVPLMQNESLNGYLESKILLDTWARESGVCTKTYTDVVRFPTNDTNRTTRFMEANCSTSSQSSYCWLTGRYRELTDSPDDDWNQLNSNASSRSNDTFVCYNVSDEKFAKWFIVTFGVLFGWLGTIDLIFKFIYRYFLGSESNNRVHPNETGATAATKIGDGQPPSREEEQIHVAEAAEHGAAATTAIGGGQLLCREEERSPDSESDAGAKAKIELQQVQSLKSKSNGALERELESMPLRSREAQSAANESNADPDLEAGEEQDEFSTSPIGSRSSILRRNAFGRSISDTSYTKLKTLSPT